MKKKPAYLESHQNGVLDKRTQTSLDQLSNCTMCPRKCAANRMNDELGVCLTGRFAKISSFGPHFGEEAPLVGHYGSGTIFFTHCNLLCNFCQNYDISHLGRGHEVTDEQLGAIMINLQNRGCHNINLVTPSHVVPHILCAMEHAINAGLTIPLVYNTGGYDAVETLNLLEGIVDIYMPDLKFFSPVTAEICELPANYGGVVRAAIREMHQQVGDLEMSTSGIACKGLLVRHLVMPGGLSDTADAMAFLANEISQNTYVNIMAQYHPCHHALQVPELARSVRPEEMKDAYEHARRNGLHRVDH